MSNVKTGPAGKVSRRSLIRTAMYAAAGASAASVAMVGAARAAKLKPEAAGYQDQPKGEQRCETCAQFVAPDSCKIVDGTISPNGWCKLWARKQAG